MKQRMTIILALIAVIFLCCAVAVGQERKQVKQRDAMDIGAKIKLGMTQKQVETKLKLAGHKLMHDRLSETEGTYSITNKDGKIVGGAVFVSEKLIRVSRRWPGTETGYGVAETLMKALSIEGGEWTKVSMQSFTTDSPALSTRSLIFARPDGTHISLRIVDLPITQQPVVIIGEGIGIGP